MPVAKSGLDNKEFDETFLVEGRQLDGFFQFRQHHRRSRVEVFINPNPVNELSSLSSLQAE